MSNLFAPSPAKRQLPPIPWERLGNVLVYANGKGGCGKTANTANTGGLAAAAGLRVLLIDLNGQGNLAEDLGYTGNPDVEDDGASLVASVTMGIALTPVKNIRPNLDVVPGGPLVREIAPLMYRRFESEGNSAVLALARALAPIAGDYDLIILDSPPENPPLLRLAMAAARWVVICMKSDEGTRKGMREVAKEFSIIREFNPYIVLLGVLLFDNGITATKIRQQVFDNVQQDLGSSDYMFETFIRHSEAVARDSRFHGKLAHELEKASKENPKFYEILRGTAQPTANPVSVTSSGVADDYSAFVKELFTRIAAKQAALVQQGVWP